MREDFLTGRTCSGEKQLCIYFVLSGEGSTRRRALEVSPGDNTAVGTVDIRYQAHLV